MIAKERCGNFVPIVLSKVAYPKKFGCFNQEGFLIIKVVKKTKWCAVYSTLSICLLGS